MTNKQINSLITNTKLTCLQILNHLKNKRHVLSNRYENSKSQSLLRHWLMQLRGEIMPNLFKRVMNILHSVGLEGARRTRQKHQSLVNKLGLTFLFFNYIDEKPDYAIKMLIFTWRYYK